MISASLESWQTSNALGSEDLAFLLDLLNLPLKTLALGPPAVQRPATADKRLKRRLSVVRTGR